MWCPSHCSDGQRNCHDDLSVGPDEIGLLYTYLDRVGTGPVIRLGLRLLLLTMVRKSERIEATWDEVNFTDAV